MKLSAFILFTAIVMIAVIAAHAVPLGILGEWQWQRHAWPQNLADFLQRSVPIFASGVLLFGVAVLGERRIATRRRLGQCIRYAALIAVAWFWFHQVQKTAPALHHDLKPYWVLYDKASSGYFFEAVFEIESLSHFLRSYEDRMREGEVLHVGTHPPGLFVLSKLCLNACEASPLLTELLNGFEDQHVRMAFRTVEADAQMAPRLTNSELAGLHLISSLTTWLAILTIIPLAMLLHQITGPVGAWRVCCLWPTLPCLAMFLPKSDLLFPFTCTSVLACCLLAMSGRRRIFYAMASAVILWVGLILSLAHLPIGVVIALTMMIRAARSGFRTVKSDAVICLTMAATLLLLSVVFSGISGCNLATVWKLNLQNHESFYSQFTRTWWKWLLANPIELAFSVGPVASVLAVVGWYTTVQQLPSKHSGEKHSDNTETVAVPLILASVLTLGLLWLSGKNQGEAARLWCFLTPWILLAAAQAPILSQRYWKVAIAVQMITASVVVSRVSGFAF